MAYRFFRYILYCLILGCLGCNKDTKMPPNIILLYADDLGWMDLSVQGSDYYQTPNIDQLANEGVRFTNAYSNAPNCAPSRASLMTGMYTPRHGIYTVNSSERGKSANRRIIPIKNTMTLDTSFITMAEMLQESGYSTCIAGKWHLSDDPSEYGFQTNFGGNHKGHPPSYFSPYKNPMLSDGPNGEYLPERLSSEVQSWLIKQEEPFFLYYPFYLVHTPNQPKPEIESEFEQIPKGTINGKSDYAAMILAMDNAVGQIVSTLKDQGKEDNTLIIFTSDNGAYGFNSLSTPLRGGKGMLYEGGIRVPFIAKWKHKIKPGTINSTPIIGTDLYPTFEKISGSLMKTSGLDGVDISSVLMGNSLAERPLFWHFPAYLQGGDKDRAMKDSHDAPNFRTTPASAIRYGDWKMIRYYEYNDIELYHLGNDISEANDLSRLQVDQFKLMQSKLDTWLLSTRAPIPTALNPEFEE